MSLSTPNLKRAVHLREALSTGYHLASRYIQPLVTYSVKLPPTAFILLNNATQLCILCACMFPYLRGAITDRLHIPTAMQR